MPGSKNASFRYRVINKLLVSRRQGITMSELVEEVSRALGEEFGNYNGISESSLRKDLNVMKSEPPRGYGAPISCKNGRYAYDDPDFTIYKMPLSENDLEVLSKARTLMRSVSGMPFSDILGGLLSKFDSLQMRQNESAYVMADFSPDFKGSEHLEVLLTAIQQGRKLRMNYHPFGSNPLERITVDPWLLKEFNGRWFLVGQSVHRKGVSVFGIDRIEQLELLDQPSPKVPVEQLQKYADVIGLSYPDDGVRERIVLRFVKERFRYIETKPIHKSQQLIASGPTHCEISLDLVVNKELISLIHYYGPDVEVLEPVHLRHTIARNIRHLNRLYGDTMG